MDNSNFVNTIQSQDSNEKTLKSSFKASDTLASQQRAEEKLIMVQKNFHPDSTLNSKENTSKMINISKQELLLIKQKFDIMVQENKELVTVNQMLQKEVNALKTASKAVLEENKQVKLEVLGLNQAKKSLKEIIKELNSANFELEEENKSTKRKMKDFQEEIANSFKKYQNISEKLQQCQSALDHENQIIKALINLIVSANGSSVKIE